MKCYCETCKGSGQVMCDDCAGSGTEEKSIGFVTLEKNHINYAELKALQEDDLRARIACRELILLKPERTASYLKQLDSTLAEINRQASKI
jgi:hypothetical protein